MLAARTASRLLAGRHCRLLCAGADEGWVPVPLRANGRLSLRLPGASLRLVSDWSDEASVRAVGLPSGADLVVGEGEGANSATVVLTGAVPAAAVVVECRVPQSTSVFAAACLGVDVAGRLEGDVTLEAGAAADVVVDKLRGSDIVLLAGGDVEVRAVVEGERVEVVAGGAVSVKRAMAGAVAMRAKAAGLSVGSLYAARAELRAAGEVDLGSAHGVVVAASAGGGVTISGLSGGASVEAAGDVAVHVDKLNAASMGDSGTEGGGADGAGAAALALRSVGGGVALTMAPAVAARLRVGAGGAVAAGKWLTEARREQEGALLRVEGEWRSSEEKSRKTNAHSGKINVVGADASSLSTSFFGKGDDEAGGIEHSMPLLNLEAPAGDVSVDRQDWQSMVLAKMALRKKLGEE